MPGFLVLAERDQPPIARISRLCSQYKASCLR
jgi:hypothetical protein